MLVAKIGIDVSPDNTSVHLMSLSEELSPAEVLDMAIEALQHERSCVRGCPAQRRRERTRD